MGLPVDIARIVRAELLPFEVDEGVYGIGWTLDDGSSGASRIGTKAEAKAIVRQITEARASASGDILKFPKDTAAS